MDLELTSKAFAWKSEYGEKIELQCLLYLFNHLVYKLIFVGITDEQFYRKLFNHILFLLLCRGACSECLFGTACLSLLGRGPCMLLARCHRTFNP